MANQEKPKNNFWGALGDALARGADRQNNDKQQQGTRIRPVKPKSGCCTRGGK